MNVIIILSAIRFYESTILQNVLTLPYQRVHVFAPLLYLFVFWLFCLLVELSRKLCDISFQEIFEGIVIVMKS